jgi:hypothetical protein
MLEKENMRKELREKKMLVPELTREQKLRQYHFKHLSKPAGIKIRDK